MTDGPYARLYLSLVDDPKFEAIYDDDHHFAAWCRLLMIAEPAWPASAHLPFTVRRASVQALAAAGLIDLQPAGRYRIHGLDAERRGRSEHAKKASSARWNAARNAPSIAPASDPRMPNQVEPSRAEPSIAREGWPNLTNEAAMALQDRTGLVWSQAGDKQLAEYDRLIGAHGLVKVLGAFDAISNGQRMTARQLVWPSLRLLEPMPDTKALAARDREAERESAADRRVQATLTRNHEAGGHFDERHPRCPKCQESAA